MTGDVDSSLLHLVASGALGGAAATTARYVRNQMSDVVRVADPTGVGRPFISTAETGFVAGLMATSFLVPTAVFLLLTVFGLLIFWRYRRQNQHMLERTSSV